MSTTKSGERQFIHPRIKDWPENERPREKLIHHGSSVLTDSELLAILISSGVGKSTAVDIAQSLLIAHASLRALASLSVADLKRFNGIGAARAVSLVAAFELGRRLNASFPPQKLVIREPGDVAGRYVPLLCDMKQEIFMVLCMTSANTIIRERTITKGLLNSSLTHPREVFREAILESAASVILLHNHPSGNREPSQEDIVMTKQIVEAGKIIGIPVHDHIIIAGNGYTSLAERGLL